MTAPSIQVPRASASTLVSRAITELESAVDSMRHIARQLEESSADVPAHADPEVLRSAAAIIRSSCMALVFEIVQVARRAGQLEGFGDVLAADESEES